MIWLQPTCRLQGRMDVSIFQEHCISISGDVQMGSEWQMGPRWWLIGYVCTGIMGKSVTNVCLLLSIPGLNDPSNGISVPNWQEPLPGAGVRLHLGGWGGRSCEDRGDIWIGLWWMLISIPRVTCPSPMASRLVLQCLECTSLAI